MEQEPHILFEKRGALGLITLNRPKALNALTHGMCLGLPKMLAEWAADDAVKAVAIRGAGTRAFCAGGDIRAMYESSIAGTQWRRRNSSPTNIALNAMIGAFPKPYVALTHGIVMGGGAGVSMHGSHRLADDDAGLRHAGNRHRLCHRYRRDAFSLALSRRDRDCIWR